MSYNKYLAEHAENYINRIRSFQDQLITWLVTWNMPLLGVAINYLNDKEKIFFSCAASSMALFLNCMAGLIYIRHRTQVTCALKRYIPELNAESPIFKNPGVIWCLMKISFLVFTIINLLIWVGTIYQFPWSASNNVSYGIMLGSIILGALSVFIFFCFFCCKCLYRGHSGAIKMDYKIKEKDVKCCANASKSAGEKKNSEL